LRLCDKILKGETMSQTHSVPLSTEEIERSFLSLDRSQNHETPIPPLEEFLDKLLILNECDDMTRRDQCYMVLQQYLVDERDFMGLVKLLKMRANWLGDLIEYGEECRDILISSTKNRMLIAKAESVSFGAEPPFGCLKRLELLCDLVPGAICSDKTWGYGVVKSEDDFYKRLVVDFERKSNHAMAFSYAAKALTLLDEKHILSIRNADINAFNEMCKKQPADVVLLALSSYGPMSVSRLESELVNGVLPEKIKWKDFWTQARQQLKKNKRIKLPPVSRKNELIEFSEVVSQIGDAQWFADFKKFTDVDDIIASLSELQQSVKTADLNDEQREIIADRLSFSLKASATKRNEKDKVRTIMAALAYGFEKLPVALRTRQSDEFQMLDDENVDLKGTFWKPEIVLAAATKLSANQINELIEYIPLATEKEVAQAYATVISDMPYNLIDKFAPILIKGPSSKEFVEKIRTEFTQINVSFPLLLWLCRNQNDESVRAILPSAVVTTQALLSLEFEVMGEKLRIQHQIARLFRDETWLKTQADNMTDVERSTLYERICSAEGVWQPSHKRAIEKFMLKTYPQVVSQTRDDAVVQPNENANRITSWRSINERREKLRILVEDDMPRLSGNLEAAREYGDLRENFEYQTAKEEQGMLLQRKSELESQLAAIKGTDFSSVSVVDRVVLGSSVTLMFEDNHSETYNILGEWDSDIALGIISVRSKLATALLGHVVGDKVIIPSEDESEVEVSVSSIQPLPRKILDWASGR
jgi:transcription elongation GreA/GreB family factor